MRLTRLLHSFVAAAALCALILPSAGCGSGGSAGGAAGNGTLTVAMSDAPGRSIHSLNITIDRVEANINGTWTAIATTPQTFNLLDLVTNTAILGSASIPAGHYTQVRLFPSSATVVDDTGTHNVTIPSGVQTGVKINVDYDITANQVTTILLDFNVNKSLIQEGNGQYRLQPVIPAVVKVLSGTITGSVTSSGAPFSGATVTATYTAGSSYPIGTAVNTSTSLSDGTFKIWALLPGTYTVSATANGLSGSVAGVVVTANADTSAGAIALH